MNHKISNHDQREMVTRTLMGIFETMLSMKLEALAEEALPDAQEHVIGSVGLGGEQVSGAVFLLVSEKFAHAMASAMLGSKPGEAIEESAINDVVSEIANMLAGGVKSRLTDDGIPCCMSTPSIIRGTSFLIETSPDVSREKFLFRFEQERIGVELHLKLT